METRSASSACPWENLPNWAGNREGLTNLSVIPCGGENGCQLVTAAQMKLQGLVPNWKHQAYPLLFAPLQSVPAQQKGTEEAGTTTLVFLFLTYRATLCSNHI